MLHKHERLLEMLTIKFWNKFVHHGDTDCFGGTVIQSMRGYFGTKANRSDEKRKKRVRYYPKEIVQRLIKCNIFTKKNSSMI